VPTGLRLGQQSKSPSLYQTSDLAFVLHYHLTEDTVSETLTVANFDLVEE
jgi:hypothetical protein